MLLNKILIINLIFLILYVFFKKTKFLMDDVKSSKHKKLVNSDSKPTLLGGVFF